MRKRPGGEGLLGPLFLWLGCLTLSLPPRLSRRSANWSNSLLLISMSGSFDRRSDLEGIAVNRPLCTVHSVLLDEQLVAGGSWGNKSLYMSFLRGFRDAICNFIFFFLGSELDTTSMSDISSTNSAGFSFELVRLAVLERLPMIVAGLGWASVLLGREVPTFGRVCSCSCPICVRLLLVRFSAQGFTADIVS